MKRIVLVVAAILFCLTAQDAYADCAGNCVNSCSHHGSGKAYADCLQSCISGCPAPDVPMPGPPQPVKSGGKG